MSIAYADFVASKTRRAGKYGPPCTSDDVSSVLYPWQRAIVAWAVRTGRAALWETTGAGKTIQQVEWARLCGARSLIVAPLAVCAQTVREAAKVGVQARYVRADEDAVGPGVWVTNYEMADRFDASRLDAVVLDEASCLRSYAGERRNAVIRQFAIVPHRLACTATPAPNDVEELTNQAEFLGVLPRAEMLATYYVHDSDAGWRLKGHARRAMFEWMTTWAVALRRPSDVGYDDTGWDLPALNITRHLLPVDVAHDGQLFATDLGGVGGRASIRRQTTAARCQQAVELIAAEPDEPWVLWAGLNDEADRLARAIPGAVNVHGSLTPEQKADLLLGFADGRFRVLITKGSVAQFGLNWQHCARMAFVGLNDSWETYFQAIRRCWRYGQARPVNVHVILSDIESRIADNVLRKEDQANHLIDGLVKQMRQANAWKAIA